MMSSSGHQKSRVAQTCNLLSQYMKGNGRLGDIVSLGMTADYLEAKKGNKFTMNLLRSLEENSAESSKQINVGASSSSTSNILENGTSQMTIFYNGEVLVFNDFSAEKAKEIMAMATEFGSSDHTSTAAAEKIDSRRAVTPDLNMASNFESNNNNNFIENPHRFCQHSQARRTSLHRFLEKRKDRTTARAPYQIKNPSSSSAMAATVNKPEDQSKY